MVRVGFRRGRGPWLGLVCACILGSVASRAQAHAPPEVWRVLWRHGDGGVVLLSNRGLIFGDPAQGNWSLMCNDALGITVFQRPDLALTSADRLLVATDIGLKATDDQGCTWQSLPPFEGSNLSAMAQAPDNPDHLFASTLDSGDHGLYASSDGGASWQARFTTSDMDYMLSLRIAPSNADRLYAAGTRVGADDTLEYYIARSDDAGMQWDRFPVELDAMTEVGLEVLAVAPDDPDVVMAKAKGGEPTAVPERLLISRDGGQSWQSPLAVLALADAAFAPDSTTLFVAGKEGLWRSADSGQSFAQLATAESMTCVLSHAGMTLACGHYAGLEASVMGKNGVGALAGADQFEPWMSFTEVTERVACTLGTKTDVVCGPPWMDWEREVFPMQNGTGGQGGAAAGAGGASGVGGAGGASGVGGMGGMGGTLVGGTGGALPSGGVGGSLPAGGGIGGGGMLQGTGGVAAATGSDDKAGGCSIAAAPPTGTNAGRYTLPALAFLLAARSRRRVRQPARSRRRVR